MVAGVLTWLSAPIAIFTAPVGAVSVFKAVYVAKRELKCACVGSSNVPLGFVSLTESVMMVAMAVWMLVGPAASHQMLPRAARVVGRGRGRYIGRRC